jgi:Protein of unknown function (DUF1688)
VIVEWRALTVALLDEIHTALKAKLQGQVDFPLVKVQWYYCTLIMLMLFSLPMRFVKLLTLS